MPTYRTIAIRRAATAALAGVMLLSLLPAATASAGDDPPPNLGAAERNVLVRMNAFRERHGLMPLRMSPELQAVAQARSRSMKQQDYFGHASPSGVDAGHLLQRNGVQHFYWGENIGWGSGLDTEAGPARMVGWWKDSPGHRWNILYKGYNYVGVGVVAKGESLIYTVVFALQRDHTPPMAWFVRQEAGFTIASVGSRQHVKRVTLRWWGRDRQLALKTAGLRGFTVDVRRGDGEWKRLFHQTRTRRVTLDLAKGDYTFRVRATDKRGNKGPWNRPITLAVR